MKLAIVASNQDTNTPYLVSGEQERTVMNRLAEVVANEARAIGIEARAIIGTPQSQDKTSLAGLHAQFRTSLFWLNGQPGAVISLHSDSGGSHIGYAYGEPGAKAMGLSVATSLEEVMHTGKLMPFAYAGWVFDADRGGYTSCLMECGSHQNSHDVDFLLNKQPEMAVAIVKGVAGFLGVPTAIPKDEHQVYFELHGIGANPDSAVFKFWRRLREGGFNPGPAISPEQDGAPYGEVGNIVQKFEDVIVVCKPSEDWACYVAQTIMEPKRWELCPA